MPHRSKSITAELPEPEELDITALADALRRGDVNLIVVLGPTASGKTKYAVRLAHSLSSLLFPGVDACRTEIISADSRQVYRGMDIGTGKDISEYGNVPYHLIDVADPGDGYNVFRFREDFFRAYRDIVGRGAVPVLCGGTGLYINSVLNDYDFSEHIPLSQKRDVFPSGEGSSPEVRGTGLMAPESEPVPYGAAEGLPNQCCSSGPSDSKTDSPGVMAFSPDGPDGTQSGLRPYVIGTLVSREVRNARIDSRLEARLKEGMIDEIRGLLDSGVPAEVLLGYGLEYKFVTRFLLGELSYDEMYLRLSTAIHQFAKRQMTWFRGMERSGIRIHWVEV